MHRTKRVMEGHPPILLSSKDARKRIAVGMSPDSEVIRPEYSSTGGEESSVYSTADPMCMKPIQIVSLQSGRRSKALFSNDSCLCFPSL